MFGLLTCCKPTTYKIKTHPNFILSQLSFFIGFFVHIKKCAIKGNRPRVAR